MKTVLSMTEKIQERGGFTPIIISGSDDRLGVVTVHDGPSLAQGHIVAPTVGDDFSIIETYHNNFQDIEKFLKAGGYRGRQYQVLTEGTYFINRMFATVELIPKTIIPVGNVGVVISYTGEKGIDKSGEDYRHGELVDEGTKGVWSTALSPGKYAFNTYAGKISIVPTTNIILKWISNEQGGHLFDSNLKEVSLITKDAFEPSLPLSVVLHIDYKKAPYVIQRFGDIKQLVEQTLDPMVSAYFKNIGQSKTLIELLQERSEIQVLASTQMKDRFNKYNIDLEEVLIGTPSASAKDNKIEIILSQLRDRQVAREQIETYSQQEKAAAKEKELNEAKSKAEQQKNLTESSINIEIQKNQGKAGLERAKHDAEKLVAMANADAAKVKALGEAEADKIAAIGNAEAEAITNKVKAYGGAKYQLIQDIISKYTAAIEAGHIQIVPNTYVNMGSGKEGSLPSPLEGLIGLMFTEKIDSFNFTPEEKEVIKTLKHSQKEEISTVKK